MISRYQNPEMAALWSEESMFNAWLEVEKQATLAWSEIGVVPREDADKIVADARFSVARIREIEQSTHHDVVAFTRCVSESLGEEKKWVHYGLTSTDVCDTAYGYLLRQANDLIRKDLDKVIETIREKALRYKDTICMGRTHGVHAEPTTFGLKLATWFSEMKRNRERFDHAAAGVEAGKISGAVGTFANTPPEVEAYVCQALGIRAQEISTQILPRDLHAEYLAALALIASSIERFATEIRHLQRSEVREAQEYFSAGQKGSSAMPHKRNPIGSENLCGIARVIRGYMHTAYENIALWHERDISHSSTERIILPDATSLVDYQLCRFDKILSGLVVFENRMKENIQATYGLVFSQRVMLKLIDKGLSREQAYDLVQPKTAQSWETGADFRGLIEDDPEIKHHLTQEEIDDAFDARYHIRHTDTIFKRVGLIK